MRKEEISPQPSEPELNQSAPQNPEVKFQKEVKAGSLDDRISLMHELGFNSWQEISDEKSRLIAEHDELLKKVGSNILYQLNIGEGTKKILALEEKISKLSWLKKNLPEDYNYLGDQTSKKAA